MNKSVKIFVAGHLGMVGSSCVRLLLNRGYTNLVLRSSKELDLRDKKSVEIFFKNEKIDIVIDAAAKVGGILANSRFPYDFLIDNLMIQNNLISLSHKYNVNKFIFLGSSCIYPKLAPQPLKEHYLLDGLLEPTNEAYAIAKIAGVKLCQSIRNQFKKNFVSLMPTNLYGPNDNFDLENAHVLPTMIRKFYEAKKNNHSTVFLWGTGSPMRDFLHVDDLATAILFFVENNSQKYDMYNVGSSKEISIKDLALLIKNISGFTGDIKWDLTKPDGTPRKLIDCSRLNKLGWSPKYDFKLGIKDTLNWYVKNHHK